MLKKAKQHAYESKAACVNFLTMTKTKILKFD